MKKLISGLKARLGAVREFESELAALRGKIATAQAALAALDTVTPSDQEIEARVVHFCNEIDRTANDHIHFHWLSQPTAANDMILSKMDGHVFGHGQAPQGALSPAQILYLANPTAFRTRALREALEAAKGERQMSAADVAVERKRLTAEIDGLEREEEAAVREAELAGLAVARRHDASPRWVLATNEEFA